MRETRLTQWLAAGLVVAAFTLIGVKWLVAGITPGRPVPPLWNIQVRLSFRSASNRSVVRLFIPRGGDGHVVVDEDFDDDQVPRQQAGVATSRNRTIHWRETTPDKSHVLGYSFWVETAPPKNGHRAPSAAMLQKLRRSTPMIQSDDASVRAQADALLAGKAGPERFEAVLDFVNENVRHDPNSSSVSAARCLKRKEGNSHSMSRLVCALLRSRRVPCQLVGGVVLEEDVRTRAYYWVEAWDGQRWVPLCAVRGISGEVPLDYLPLFRGDYSLAKFRDCEETDVLVSIEQREPPPRVQAQVARHSPSVFDRLSLASLPRDTQQVVGLLLLLPVGALMVACFRNFVGVSTFGIFMPILLALAFRETHLVWGLIYLTVLVGAGVLARWALHRLKLLMIPRLATVLTLIVTMMIGLVFLGSRYGIHGALSVGLFPMVIMTTAVERFFVIQSEDSTAAALKESLTTVLVAACGFFLFHWKWLHEVLFTYPELLLVVVALLLLVGRYSGYRLMELRRFRWLAWGSTLD